MAGHPLIITGAFARRGAGTTRGVPSRGLGTGVRRGHGDPLGAGDMVRRGHIIRRHGDITLRVRRIMDIIRRVLLITVITHITVPVQVVPTLLMQVGRTIPVPVEITTVQVQ